MMKSNLFKHGVSLFLMVLQWKEFDRSLELCAKSNFQNKRMHGKYCLVIEIIWMVISVKLDAPQQITKVAATQT